jgi:homoserine O-acetyltransferase
MSFSTDWRFPPERSKEIVTDLLKAGKEVSYLEIEADQGHDAFLLPIPRYVNALSCYLKKVHEGVSSNAS